MGPGKQYIFGENKKLLEEEEEQLEQEITFKAVQKKRLSEKKETRSSSNITFSLAIFDITEIFWRERSGSSRRERHQTFNERRKSEAERGEG